MDKGYTREQLIGMMKQMQMLHHYYNVIDDIDTIGSDDLKVYLDSDTKFTPDSIAHYCRKCKEISTFYAYRTDAQPSTYVLETVINDQPMIMYRKIYRCSCGREFITVTSVFEQVGHNLEYGFRPIDYEDYYKKIEEENKLEGEKNESK